MKKDNDIHIRADDDTIKKLHKMCQVSRGLTQSKVIRKAIMNCKIEDIKGKTEIIIQLKKIGNNLNQITSRINAGQITDADILSEQISRINKELTIALDKLYGSKIKTPKEKKKG